jgi:hypothetical protein
MEIRAALSLHLHHDQKSRGAALLRLGVVLIATAMLAGGSLHPSKSGKAEIAMTTQHESDDAKNDCEIFTLLGREILGWGKVDPDISQFAIFYRYRPQGGGYVEQCPWAKLGIEPLKAAKPDPDNMRYFTAPKYGADGKAATVSFVTHLVGRNPDGSARPPFISQEELSLTKIDGHWRLVSRKLSAIT